MFTHPRSLAKVAILSLCALLAACASPAATSAPNPTDSAAGPLVGAWTTTVTKQDLAAGGLSDPAAQNENSGTFTWTFAPDGTWTTVQQSIDGSPVHNPIFRGTYVLDGSTLVATTQFPTEYQDSGLRYAWTLDGTSVRFDVLNPPDAILPILVESHPWTRIS